MENKQRTDEGERQIVGERRVSVVALDLDGTLLGLDKKISGENARALRECREKGIHIVLASGRSFESIRTFAIGIGVDCAVISCNGARMDASVHGPLMMQDCIEEEQAVRLFEALVEENVYFECYTPGRIYMTDGFVERFHSHEARVMELDGRRLEYIDGTDRMRREAMGCAYKFVVFSPDHEKLIKVSRKMAGYKIDVTSSWGDNIELMKKGAGKGKALLAYAAAHGIEAKEIMAFGDQINDLDMLEASGWPVAMENAVPELKAGARLIAPHHDCSGVGKILRQYVLNRGEMI